MKKHSNNLLNEQEKLHLFPGLLKKPSSICGLSHETSWFFTNGTLSQYWDMFGALTTNIKNLEIFGLNSDLYYFDALEGSKLDFHSSFSQFEWVKMTDQLVER